MTNIEKTILSSVEERLRVGAIAPLFRKYAIPGVIALLFIGLQTIIDGVVLGNFVGANALASVSLILPCYSFIVALAIVVGIGCQTVISISLGKLDHQGAHNALRSAFVFLILFSSASSIVIYIFATDIARLFGANDVLLDGSVGYLRGLIPFFMPIVLMFFFDLVIKSIGRPVYSMITMSSTVILNIILDLLFVAKWDMGTMGAGLATGVAFTIGVMINAPVIFNKKCMVSVQKGYFKWKLLLKMAYNGSSEGVSELSSGISTLFFNLAIIKYLGEAGVAAFTAINYVFFIGVIIFLGVSDGIIPIVSYNYGAGQWHRIKQTVKIGIKTNFIIGLTLFLMLYFFGGEMVSLFFNEEEADVIRIAMHGTSIYAFAFLINGFNIFSASYFTAMANAKISIIISLLRSLIFVVIGINILPNIFGIEGIWYAVPFAEVLTLIVSLTLVWRSLKYHEANF